MGLGERIAAKRQSNRKKIEVSEWGEESALVIYSGPLTCADVAKLQRKHKDFLNSLSVEAMVDLIIMKAEDKNGEKLFTLEDKPFLMREPVSVITSVGGEMFVAVPSEEFEKN